MGVALDWINCLQLWLKLFVTLPGDKAAVLPRDSRVVALVCKELLGSYSPSVQSYCAVFLKIYPVNSLSNLQQAPHLTGHYPCRDIQQTGAGPSFGNSRLLKSCTITLRTTEMLLKLLSILLQRFPYLFIPLVGNGHWQRCLSTVKPDNRINSSGN